MRHFHVYDLSTHLSVTSLTYYNESMCLCFMDILKSPPINSLECVIKLRENSLREIIKNAQIHYENEEESCRCRFVEQKLSACEIHSHTRVYHNFYDDKIRDISA